MTGHPNYAFPTKSEKYCQCSIYIYDYMLKHNIEFKNIQYDNIYIDFIKDKKLEKQADIKKSHFKFVLDDINIYNLYLYLNDNLFHSIISLSTIVANLIEKQFPELYKNFNINLINIETSLKLFKSFVINFNTGQEDNDSIRQGAVDIHKDTNDVLNAFCVIVVFGKFTGGDLVLNEINIILQNEGGFIILLRSALLEHFNSKVLSGARWSIVFYLRKDIFNEN